MAQTEAIASSRADRRATTSRAEQVSLFLGIFRWIIDRFMVASCWPRLTIPDPRGTSFGGDMGVESLPPASDSRAALVQGLDQLFDPDGLGQTIVHSRGQAERAILDRVAGRQGDDPGPRKIRVPGLASRRPPDRPSRAFAGPATPRHSRGEGPRRALRGHCSQRPPHARDASTFPDTRRMISLSSASKIRSAGTLAVRVGLRPRARFKVGMVDRLTFEGPQHRGGGLSRAWSPDHALYLPILHTFVQRSSHDFPLLVGRARRSARATHQGVLGCADPPGDWPRAAGPIRPVRASRARASAWAIGEARG